MSAVNTDRGNFIVYPTNRVVGTVGDADKARETVGALLAAGFEHKDVDILNGEADLKRLDPSGTGQGLVAQFQRTLIRTFELDEFKHLMHHIEDVRAGRRVIMVLTKKKEQRIVAADILHQHGADYVGFYGRWAWEGLPATALKTPEDVPASFVRAWNAHDAAALASIFDEDAEFVNVTGLCWHDRESIRKAHADGLDTIFDKSSLTIDDMKVKYLAADVALVQAHMTVKCQADAGPPVPRSTIVSFVVHQFGDRWQCASAHNTGVN